MYLYERYATVSWWYDKHKNEFGAPRWYNLLAHKIGDVFVWTWEGKRIAEHHPDDSKYLCIPRIGLSAGIKTRWVSLLGDASISVDHRKIRRVTGVSEWYIRFTQRSDKFVMKEGGQYREREWHTVGDIANVRQRIKIDVTRDSEGVLSVHSITEADPAELQVEKDKAKYAYFNKGLKKLKATLITQIKMGVYEEFSSRRWNRSESLNTYINELCGSKHIHWSGLRPKLYEYVRTWTETQDSSLLKPIVACSLLIHDSLIDEPHKRMINQIKSALAAAQVEYLRKECVTITESNKTPSLTNENQECLVQSTDGLREVQVPCEAEICR